MKKIFMIIITGLVMVGPAGVHAEDDAFVKTEKGLHFAVPEDWPIEEHGGALAPISVEEYVVRKFKAIEVRLKTIESGLSQQAGDLKGAASVIKSQSEAGQSSESSAEMAGQLEVLTRDVSLLKTQVQTGGSSKSAELIRNVEEKDVSDKNIAEQIRLIRARLEDVERRLGTVEFHQDN